MKGAIRGRTPVTSSLALKGIPIDKRAREFVTWERLEENCGYQAFSLSSFLWYNNPNPKSDV